MAPLSGRFCVSLITDENADIAAAIEATIAKLDQVKQEIGRVIFGQEGVVQETLITLLAGGHALLVGVPGLAKTRLAETLGVVLGLAQKRVQFTPDLMPADILGSEVLDDAGTGQPELPLHPRPDLRPAADGRRDQPREPAHPGGAAAGDAGAQGHRGRARIMPCRRRSTSSRPRTRSSRRAPIRCPRRSSTGSSCRSTSTIRRSRPSGG